MLLFQLSNQNLAFCIISVLVIHQFVQWVRDLLTRRSISHLLGPPNTDWLFGNLTDIFFDEVGTYHFAWQKKYGYSYKAHGLFGVRVLDLTPFFRLHNDAFSNTT
jgi:hypothetical protein